MKPATALSREQDVPTRDQIWANVWKQRRETVQETAARIQEINLKKRKKERIQARGFSRGPCFLGVKSKVGKKQGWKGVWS